LTTKGFVRIAPAAHDDIPNLSRESNELCFVGLYRTRGDGARERVGTVRNPGAHSARGHILGGPSVGLWRLLRELQSTEPRVNGGKAISAETSGQNRHLTELFSPGGTSTFTNYYDPCSAVYINAGSSTRPANCAKLGVPANYVDPLAAEGRTELVSGNPNLTAETAKSWTVGTVLTPRFLPRFTWTIDWWDIDIDSAINTLPVQQIINGCVDGPTLNVSECSLITRGGPNSAGGNVQNAITLVSLEPLNIGILEAEGVDTSAAYLFDLPSHFLNVSNEIRLTLEGSYTMKNNSVVDANDPSNVIQSAGDYTLPKVRANLIATFLASPLSVSAKVRYIGKSKVDVTYTPLFSNDNDVASRTYLDLYASYMLTSKLKLSVGMNNAFDTAPPQTATTYTGTSTLFDVVGRYFFAQVSAKL